MVIFHWKLLHPSPQSPSISLFSSLPLFTLAARNAWWVTLWGLTSPLQACQPQSAVIWCEMYALVQASQGQGLVIIVSYSSVSYVSSSSLHSSFCLDKLFEDLLTFLKAPRSVPLLPGLNVFASLEAQRWWHTAGHIQRAVFLWQHWGSISMHNNWDKTCRSLTFTLVFSKSSLKWL